MTMKEEEEVVEAVVAGASAKTTTTTTTINTVAVDVLILILRRFPLSELIRLRAVCTHWRTVIDGLFRLKRSLKLFGEAADIAQYANKLHFINLKTTTDYLGLKEVGLDDDLILSDPERFTFSVCDQLAELFPSVVHLVVYIGQPAGRRLWSRIPYMMKLFPHLVSLSVHGLEHGALSSRIFLAIDAMFSLSSLDVSLHYNNSSSSNCEEVPNSPPPPSPSSPPSSPPSSGPIFHLPDLLPQLEHFSLSLYKYSPSASSSSSAGLELIVGQLSAAKCRRLSLEWEHMAFERHFKPSFTSTPEAAQLASSLTHLTLRCIKGNDYLPFLSAHFGGLQYLSILFSSLTMIKFNAELCSNHLNRLVHLKELRIAAIHIHVAPPEKSGPPLTPLSTVRRLDIAALNFSSDAEFKFKPLSFCKTLALIFPSIEELTVRCNRQDVIEQLTAERLKGAFTRLKRHRVFADYEEHREFLGKYKNVSADFFIKRMSFASI